MVEHEATIRGLGLSSPGGAPAILQRTDQDFIPAILDELADKARREALTKDVAKTRESNGVLKLFQPVQRTFHVAVIDVSCSRLGRPRLSPDRIESAGLVIRRLTDSANPTLERWAKTDNRLRGWVRFDGPSEMDLDPDPKLRRPSLTAGNPEIDRRLSLLRPAPDPLAENVSPLFVAPPDVCESAKRTIVYGLIPLTSSERSEEPVEATGMDDDDVASHLSVLLKRTSSTSGYSWLGKTLTADSSKDPVVALHLETLMVCLEQLQIELDAFGDSQDSLDLLNLLNQVSLPYDGGTRPAGAVLKEAAQVFLDRSRTSVTMPQSWPAISSAGISAIQSLAKRILDRRIATVSPSEGRYDGAGRRYQLRAFVRVKGDPQCPAKIVWSEPSEPFTIAPWYESGDVPPVQVTLPNPDSNFLEKVKPNVSFVVPEPIFNSLRGMGLGDLIEGKKGGGGGIGLDWICGFNIPIITLCAFIVLSIFLGLLNIVFWWLPFVKICIPIPRKG